MNFINSIDFPLVGLLICFLYEAFGRSFNLYTTSLSREMTPSDIPGGTCLLALFYLVFMVVMLWSPYLWFPAALLLLLGIITPTVTKPGTKKVKELIKTRKVQDTKEILRRRKHIEAAFIIDKIISLGLIGWMIFLHLQNLGLIK